MSQNWKDIGRFSNSKTYRNVNLITIGKNNIGKLRYFYDENKNNTRGSLFDITSVNEMIGIGTNKPFSKLSLGDISGSGTFNIYSPVYEGEIQNNGLGMNTDIFSEKGKSLINKKGELVCKRS